MNDAELLHRIKTIAIAKHLNTSIFYDHGSVRNTAMLAAGLMCTAPVVEGQYQWDGIFAATKVLEIFDSSPGALGACLMVGTLKDSGTTVRYDDVLATKALLKSAHVPKIMDEYTEHVRGDASVGAELSNILLVHDLVTMLRTIDLVKPITDMVDTVFPMGYGFHQTLFEMECRIEDFEQAHPVLRNLASETFPEYKALFVRDEPKCANG